MDAILDAAAVLIATHGLEGLTVHGIAKRARTSIGSLYHFFPDVDSITHALVARHFEAVRQMNEDLALQDGVFWRGLTTEQTVDGFLAPLLKYVDKHPDVFPLLRLRTVVGEPGVRSGTLALLEDVLGARFPRATRQQRALRATMFMAIIDGLFNTDTRTFGRASVRRELRRALVAYLRALERAHG